MNEVVIPQSHCLAGVARCDITPPVGIYHRMWGAALHDKSTGVHRPLTATVLYLQSHEQPTQPPYIVISLDHCLFWAREMDDLLDAVSQRASVERSSLIVYFSHTHASGLMGLERKHLPGGDLIEPYLAELANRVTRLVIEARDALKPASIVYGHGKCDLAKNRDFLDLEKGKYVCGFNPGGVTDDTVLIGRVADEQGGLIATVVNYACHPTTLAWENTLISPDYLGAMREVVERATNVPCLFLQGASGDLGPQESYVGDVEIADRNGRQLGHAALATLETLPKAGYRFTYTGPVLSGATLGTWKYTAESAEQQAPKSLWAFQCDTVPLKYRNDLPSREGLEQDDVRYRAEEKQALEAGDAEQARKSRAMIERTTRSLLRIAPLPPGDAYPYPVISWRIGDAVWLALDGEHYNVLQRELRSRFPGVPLMIGTIANGSKVWYLPPASSYGLGLYQEEASILAKGCLEAVLEAATSTIQKLLAK
ncbi:hypothetical protein [Schlesneria sp. T3-172]|uniref:hypothetical protein n=1 Tax=Schlesneria sphaerica TaxID=3373610 RepID=UPI0037C94723